MKKLVKDRFDEFPENARTRLEALRSLVFKVASELDLGEVEESLKWGEPSYSVKSGSSLRFDWSRSLLIIIISSFIVRLSW